MIEIVAQPIDSVTPPPEATPQSAFLVFGTDGNLYLVKYDGTSRIAFAGAQPEPGELGKAFKLPVISVYDVRPPAANFQEGDRLLILATAEIVMLVAGAWVVDEVVLGSLVVVREDSEFGKSGVWLYLEKYVMEKLIHAFESDLAGTNIDNILWGRPGQNKNFYVLRGKRTLAHGAYTYTKCDMLAFEPNEEGEFKNYQVEADRLSLGTTEVFGTCMAIDPSRNDLFITMESLGVSEDVGRYGGVIKMEFPNETTAPLTDFSITRYSIEEGSFPSKVVGGLIGATMEGVLVFGLNSYNDSFDFSCIDLEGTGWRCTFSFGYNNASTHLIGFLNEALQEKYGSSFVYNEMTCYVDVAASDHSTELEASEFFVAYGTACSLVTFDHAVWTDRSAAMVTALFAGSKPKDLKPRANCVSIGSKIYGGLEYYGQNFALWAYNMTNNTIAKVGMNVITEPFFQLQNLGGYLYMATDSNKVVRYSISGNTMTEHLAFQGRYIVGISACADENKLYAYTVSAVLGSIGRYIAEVFYFDEETADFVKDFKKSDAFNTYWQKNEPVVLVQQ